MASISHWFLAALTALPLAAQVTGPDVARKLGAASEALAAGNGRAATLVLEDLVDDQPDLGVAWYQLAVARRLLHEEAKAFRAAERAETLMPESMDAKVLLAEICAGSDPTRASSLATAVLDASPDDAMLRRLLPVLVTARDPRTKGVFDRVLSAAPTDLAVLDQKAQWALGNQDLTTAIAVLNQMVTLEPMNPMPLQSLAQAQLAAGKSELALQTLRRLLAVNPSNIEGRTRLIAVLREQQKDTAEIDSQQRLLAYYRAQVQRWEQQGKTEARPTGVPPKPAK